MQIWEIIEKTFNIANAALVLVVGALVAWYARSMGPKLKLDALVQSNEVFRETVDDQLKLLSRYQDRNRRHEARIETLEQELDELREEIRGCYEEIRELKGERRQ